MKRLFDVLFSSFLLVVLSPIVIFIWFLVRLTSKGPALYWSDRVGLSSGIFRMPKFRSMRLDTPALATHLLRNPDAYLSPVGAFLRSSSVDEIPQLWSVLKGDMSIVGPRPALYNQYDLIQLRAEKGVDKIRPGITGWAQVNGRDDIDIPMKVKLDAHYVNNISFFMDMKILYLTLRKVLSREGVSH